MAVGMIAVLVAKIVGAVHRLRTRTPRLERRAIG